MTSLTATVRPATRSARSLLQTVGASLRRLDHVAVSPTEALIEWPGLGTVMLTESPGEIVLSVSDQSAAMPGARQAISQQIRQAAGSRAAVAKLVISWSDSVPSLESLAGRVTS